MSQQLTQFFFTSYLFTVCILYVFGQKLEYFSEKSCFCLLTVVVNFLIQAQLSYVKNIK